MGEPYSKKRQKVQKISSLPECQSSRKTHYEAMEHLFVSHSSPKGYPKIGLSAKSIQLPERSKASAKAITNKIVNWERARGNSSFVVTGLEKLTPDQRLEVAHIYISLREWYPLVVADRLDLGVRGISDKLGYSYIYSATFPILRNVFTSTSMRGTPEAYEFASALAKTLGRKAVDLNREVKDTKLLGVQDITTAGSIKIGVMATSARGIKEMHSIWNSKNSKSVSSKRHLEVQPVEVSLLALTLVHEFAHLVDGALADQGPHALDRVYGAISTQVLDIDRPEISQWRFHLANYPVSILENSKGPVSGGQSRSKTTKSALGVSISEKLGKYASTSREELMAEAFMLAWTAKDRKLKRSLNKIREELVEIGIARATPPKKIS